eukprot:465086-Pyramimonas_sp.AAC.1
MSRVPRHCASHTTPASVVSRIQVLCPSRARSVGTFESLLGKTFSAHCAPIVCDALVGSPPKSRMSRRALSVY